MLRKLRHPHVVDDVLDRKHCLCGRFPWPRPSYRRVQDHVPRLVPKQRRWGQRCRRDVENDHVVDGEHQVPHSTLYGEFMERFVPLGPQLGRAALLQMPNRVAARLAGVRRLPVIRAVHNALAVDHLHDIHFPEVGVAPCLGVARGVRHHPVGRPHALRGALANVPGELRGDAGPEGPVGGPPLPLAHRRDGASGVIPGFVRLPLGCQDQVPVLAGNVVWAAGCGPAHAPRINVRDKNVPVAYVQGVARKLFLEDPREGWSVAEGERRQLLQQHLSRRHRQS